MLHIQIGQSGNNVGKHFWQTLLSEHKIDEQGIHLSPDEGNDLKRLYFEESNKRYYIFYY